jgi:hypothetical protein
MKSLQMIRIITAGIFVIALFCSPVQAEISFSGDLEIDTSYTTTSTDPSTDTTQYDSGGRIKVVPAARTEAGNLYMEAVAQILAKTDNTDGSGVQIDDAYGKIGTSVFDIQIGRFEAWNLFDESNDMLIVDAPTGPGRYKANYARGRIDSAGQLALHVFSGDAFGFEAGFVYGQDDVALGYQEYINYTDAGGLPVWAGTSVDTASNMIGFRPVVNAKFGNFEFSGGFDLLKTTPQDDDLDAEITKTGYGARIKAVLGMATLGINYASGTVETTAPQYDGTGNLTGHADQPDETTDSYGGYCDLALGDGVLTLAAVFTNWEADNNPFEQEHNQYYAAYAHPLPIEGATIKFAVSSATADDEDPSAGDSDALAFKVRLNYNF